MKKNLKTVFMSLLACFTLCACSADKIIDEPDPSNSSADNGEGFYMGVDIQMPGGFGSRSETNPDGTSSAGTEVGQESENTVTNALIVLAASRNYSDILPEWGFIAASEVQNNRIQDLNVTANKQYRATAKLQKTLLEQFYQQTSQTASEYPVYVFVFCNPTKALISMFTDGTVEFGKTNWRDEICEVRQGQGANNYNVGIWGANSFLMNNVSLATRYLPGKLLDWENYNTVEKAFHLSDNNDGGVDNSVEGGSGRGSIRVERSVARFDFRDGSGNNNTYNVLYAYNNDGTPNTSAPLVNVKLQKMCLVNMSNAFYFIPRVSADGQNTNVTYCGAEKPWIRNPQTGEIEEGNYVVGPYASRFVQPLMDPESSVPSMKFDDYFNFPFFENDGTFNHNFLTADRWDVVAIDDVLNGVSDNYKGSDNTVTDANGNPYQYDGSFKIWRYVTENVIPSPFTTQKNGISTGVVFRGRLLGAYKDGADYNEEAWNKGYSQNLDNCLNGRQFTYNGQQTTLQGNSQADPILYYISGNLYMGWRHLRQAAIQASVTKNVSGQLEINRSNTLYKAVFGDGPIPAGNRWMDSDGTNGIDIVDPRWGAEGEDAKYKQSPEYFWSVWAGEDRPTGGDGEEAETPQSLVNFRSAVTAQGVTIYQSAREDNVPGYYCYYYYWNRHNDNHVAGVMGGMEFDVVRNNVYKLWVDKISRLGHPRVPGNDPEPPTPDTPDESDVIYLDVRVAIVPWSVRLNSITF